MPSGRVASWSVLLQLIIIYVSEDEGEETENPLSRAAKVTGTDIILTLCLHQRALCHPTGQHEGTLRDVTMGRKIQKVIIC